MNREHVYGFCGITAAVVAIVSVILGVYYTPNFSWTDNWISDLGGADEPGRREITTVTGSGFFNNGLMISGLLGLGLSLGLWSRLGKMGKAGSLMLLGGSVSLIGVGAFPGTGVLHTEFSVVFFVFALLSMLLVGTDLNPRRIGRVSLLIWVAAVPFAFAVFSFAAVPEFIAISLISFWTLLMGIHLVRMSSLSELSGLRN